MKNCYTSLLVFSIIFVVVFSLFPQIDLIISSQFYSERSNNFPMSRNAVSRFAYILVRYFSIFLFFVGAGCFIYDMLLKKLSVIKVFQPLRKIFKITTSQSLYLASVVFVIPFFVIHYVFKPLWGRPRPVEINEFSGIYDFAPIYHFNPSWDFNSFPSGHTSMAFSVFALYYIVPEHIRPKIHTLLWLWAIMGGVNRVIAGGHFASDVIASAIITLFGVMVLKKLILK